MAQVEGSGTAEIVAVTYCVLSLKLEIPIVQLEFASRVRRSRERGADFKEGASANFSDQRAKGEAEAHPDSIVRNLDQ